MAQTGELRHQTRGPGRCGPAESVGPVWTRTSCSGGTPGGGWQDHTAAWGLCDPAWLSADPEPTAVPRHGPLLVQRGRILLFEHSRPRQALQVRSPCTALVGVAGRAPEELEARRVRSMFPRRRNLGEVQGGYEHVMDPSPVCPGSSPPHRAALHTRGPGLCVEARSPPDPKSEWLLSRDRQMGPGRMVPLIPISAWLWYPGSDAGDHI